MLRPGLINRAAIIVIAGWLALPVTPTLAQSQLPPCPTGQNVRRHMCQGTFTLADGGRFVGEFRNGKRNGQGTFTFANGDRYVGEFRDDKRNGQGSLFGPDQRLLQNGIWRDDVLIQANNLPTPSY